MLPRRAILSATIVSVVIGVLTAVGAYWWRQGRGIDPDNPQQVALGRQVYAARCAECHGAALQGEADWRTRKPDGKLPAPPQDASGHTWHHPDETLFAMTKYGMSRFAPPDYKSDMPSFVGILSDSEIRAVIAFIKSTWPEEIRQRQESLSQR